MTVAEQVGDKVSRLPEHDQRIVLEYVEALAARAKSSGATGIPRRDPRGVLAGRIPDPSLDDLAATRREMWSRFPRDI